MTSVSHLDLDINYALSIDLDQLDCSRGCFLGFQKTTDVGGGRQVSWGRWREWRRPGSLIGRSEGGGPWGEGVGRREPLGSERCAEHCSAKTPNIDL